MEKEFVSAVESLRYLIDTWEGIPPPELRRARYKLNKGGQRVGKTKIGHMGECGATNLIKRHGEGRVKITTKFVFEK